MLRNEKLVEAFRENVYFKTTERQHAVEGNKVENDESSYE